MTTAAVAGLLYWLTPSHTITFVHPVQRPLVQPNVRNVCASEGNIGQTYAQLLNSGPVVKKVRTYPLIPIHGKSTIRADLLANWKEPIDDGVDPNGFHLVSGHAQVLEAALRNNDTGMKLHSLRESSP